jgi:hypothetical protein
MNKSAAAVLKNGTKDLLNLSPTHEKLPENLNLFNGTGVAQS